MKLNPIILCVCTGLLVLSLVSCGGGSGTSTVDLQGTTTVTFPVQGGEIIGTDTTVCGSSVGDVDAVFVNGLAATSTDGFRTWRLNLTLPTGDNTIMIESRAQGLLVDQQSIQVRNEDEYLGWIHRVSREENGVFVAYDQSSDMLVRVDRNNMSRQKLELNEMVLGFPLAYTIQEVEFDPIENRAILFDTQSGPRIVFADFDSGQIDSLALPVTTMGEVQEIELDLAGNRIFLRSHLNSVGGGGPGDRIYVIDVASQTLSLVSDENSPGSFASPSLQMLTWEPTTSELYAYRPLLNEILKIDIQTGARSQFIDLTTLGVSNGLGFDRMSVASNPLRFLLLPHELTFTPPIAEPKLIDASTLTVTAIPFSNIYFGVYDDLLAGASADELRFNFGNAIVTVNADGSTTPDFELGLTRNAFAGTKLSFDSERRRLITASQSELLSFDLATTVVSGVPDPEAPANSPNAPYIAPGYAYMQDSFYDQSRDEILFRDGLKIYRIPASGGMRAEVRTSESNIVGPVVFDAQNQCYWMATAVGSPKVYAFSRLNLLGTLVSTFSTSIQPLGAGVVGYDLENGQAYIHGSAISGGGPQISRCDLLAMTTSTLSFEIAGGASINQVTALEAVPEKNQLLVLSPAGLVSVDLQTGIRTLVHDFVDSLSSIRVFRGLTRDPSSGLLFISAIGAAVETLNYGVSAVILAYEMESNSVEVIGRR